MRTGRRGSVTTAWPSAASVGASRTARTSASAMLSEPNNSAAQSAPAAIVSRQADRQQPERQPVVAPQRAHVDPGGVREQHKRERRLREDADRGTGRRDGDLSEHARSGEQPQSHEQHRRGDRAAREPPRDRGDDKHCQRNCGQRPAHRGSPRGKPDPVRIRAPESRGPTTETLRPIEMIPGRPPWNENPCMRRRPIAHTVGA